MNMMYAIYIKDIKIQGYKDTMNIWGEEVVMRVWR